MKKITTFFLNIFAVERDNLWLFVSVLLGFGVAFYFSFEESFLMNFGVLVALFFVAVLLSFLNRYSLRFLVFLACTLFLAGSFYAHFYQKIFLNHTKITGKIYVDGVGKITAIQKFVNPVNGVVGANLVIAEPKLYKSKFVEKQKKIKKKKVKKKKAKKKKIKKEKKKRKPRSRYLGKCVVTVESDSANAPDCHPAIAAGSTDDLEVKEKKKKPKKKKPKKKKPISEKTIQKNFLNLADYQEIDREFLDYSKNYQQVEWLKIKDREVFPNPPQKISLNLIKNSAHLKVNDVIAFRAMLQPPKAREFPDDFDFNLDAKFKKIGAYGFVLGEVKTMSEAEISSLDEWFLSLREKIRGKILNAISGDEAAIALAFLIGDQSQISKDIMSKIRNSGLAHLLSISGFHLSLASAICFISARFILSRSEYLTLSFDLKKIAAIAAIIGTYFYLKIAASPLPAQRAFVMVILVLIALFVGEKINAKRAVMTAALGLILLNPFAVFNISFQLTFAAILILVNFSNTKNHDRDLHFLRRLWNYFSQIILISIFIQIATTPFLMRSFQNVVLLGFIANIIAIPLSSFIIMPLGFLALFFMPFGLEKYFLILMGKGIFLIEELAIFVTNLNFSHLASPIITSFGIVFAVIGLLLFCLLESRFRFVGIAIFSLSFTTIFFTSTPDILFESKQKFFAVKTADGLVFSKNLKPSKQRQLWLNKMNEKEFKSLQNNPQSEIICEENQCVIEKNKKFLVLLKRSKISEICKNDFDVIVNLTAKYKLPDCIAENKIKIDNKDFYLKGGQFLKYNGSFFTF